jgi:hypothetical protein
MTTAADPATQVSEHHAVRPIDHAGERARWRLAGWCLAIAATGTPATVAVLILGQGAEATAGATAIGTITVAALGAARAFGRAEIPADPPYAHRRIRRRLPPDPPRESPTPVNPPPHPSVNPC